MDGNSIKAALGAFAEKFRSQAQGIDEVDRDNPAITTAIKYMGGDLTLEPIILKAREPVYVTKPDGTVTLEAKDVEVIAVDGQGVPVYKKTLKCAPVADKDALKEGITQAGKIEIETIKTHAQTQNYHVVAGLILGTWGALMVYFIVQSIMAVF